MALKYEILQSKDKIQISLELVHDLVEPIITSVLALEDGVLENPQAISKADISALNSDLKSFLASLVFDIKGMTEIPLPFGT